MLQVEAIFFIIIKGVYFCLIMTSVIFYNMKTNSILRDEGFCFKKCIEGLYMIFSSV